MTKQEFEDAVFEINKEALLCGIESEGDSKELENFFARIDSRLNNLVITAFFSITKDEIAQAISNAKNRLMKLENK